VDKYKLIRQVLSKRIDISDILGKKSYDKKEKNHIEFTPQDLYDVQNKLTSSSAVSSQLKRLIKNNDWIIKVERGVYRIIDIQKAVDYVESNNKSNGKATKQRKGSSGLVDGKPKNIGGFSRNHRLHSESWIINAKRGELFNKLFDWEKATDLKAYTDWKKDYRLSNGMMGHFHIRAGNDSINLKYWVDTYYIPIERFGEIIEHIRLSIQDGYYWLYEKYGLKLNKTRVEWGENLKGEFAVEIPITLQNELAKWFDVGEDNLYRIKNAIYYTDKSAQNSIFGGDFETRNTEFFDNLTGAIRYFNGRTEQDHQFIKALNGINDKLERRDKEVVEVLDRIADDLNVLHDENRKISQILERLLPETEKRDLQVKDDKDSYVAYQ